MPMSTALSTLIPWNQRNRPSHGQHERLETTEQEEQVENTVSDEEVANTARVVSHDNDDDEAMEEVTLSEEVVPAVTHSDNDTHDDGVEEDAAMNGPVGLRRTLTLVELEEERELARRRTSACVLIGVFVLFRVWIVAIQSESFPLVCLCLVFTSWTARYIRSNREYEEELDQRIAEYGQDAADEPRLDMRGLSFQAQLALAIMESQRQMMQGGHGHPDGQSRRSQGVSESIREEWERHKYKTGKYSYGSLSQKEENVKGDLEQGLEEEPACSICLCEYEEGETIVGLPCNHLYHEDCVMSWTSNHVRCPLCNYDLGEVPSPQAESVV